ncbi:retrovirus-related pol polyprotein from transposon TNT 1-94 [Tanacetum coccineum]
MHQNPLSRNPGDTFGCFMRKQVRHGLGGLRNNVHHDINECLKPKRNRSYKITLFIVDSGCTKHMTGNLKLLCNFVEKYLDIQGNDLLMDNHRSDLYTISLQETSLPTSICFMAKASPTQAWLWQYILSHLNFDTINLLFKKDIVNGLPKLKYIKDQLCPSCEMGKAKRSTFKTNIVLSSKGRLIFLHMDLCGHMRIESINEKKYIVVIVDDYSRYTWTHFLRSKDETSEVLRDFLKMIQRNLQAQVITVQTNRGTEFLNKTLHAYFKEEEIEHHTSIARTTKYNGIVERWNRTMVEVARINSDHNSSELEIQDHDNKPSSSKLVQNVSPPADTDAPSLQELDLLFSHLFEEYFTAGNQSVSKSSVLFDNLQQQDIQPTLNVQPTLEPTTPPTNVNAKENNTDKESDA